MTELGILYYLHSYPKISESFVLNEISELKRRGHNVAVFALFNPNEDLAHEEYSNIDIPVYYVEPSITDLYQLFNSKSLTLDFLNYGTMFRIFSVKELVMSIISAKECVEYIRSLDFEVDVIHGHFADSSKLGQIITAKHCNVHATITAHAYEIFKSPDIAQLSFICNSFDHIIVPSKYNQKYLHGIKKIKNEITVIPATTRIDKFEASNNEVSNRILTVGRLVEKKGYKYGIKAVAQLVEQGHKIDYHIIGTGDEKNYLEELVLTLGIEDHVEFLGHVSDMELKKELREASVFILPCVVASNGDRDAMPVVLKEAMAAEVACISTAVSAVPELITHKKDGLLVPQKDSEALADAIEDLLSNDKLREDLARNGKETVEKKFDISESVDKLENVFRSLTLET